MPDVPLETAAAQARPVITRANNSRLTRTTTALDRSKPKFPGVTDEGGLREDRTCRKARTRLRRLCVRPTKPSKRDAADAMRSATEYLITTRQAKRALKARNCAPSSPVRDQHGVRGISVLWRLSVETEEENYCGVGRQWVGMCVR